MKLWQYQSIVLHSLSLTHRFCTHTPHTTSSCNISMFECIYSFFSEVLRPTPQRPWRICTLLLPSHLPPRVYGPQHLACIKTSPPPIPLAAFLFSLRRFLEEAEAYRWHVIPRWLCIRNTGSRVEILWNILSEFTYYVIAYCNSPFQVMQLVCFRFSILFNSPSFLLSFNMFI